MLSVTMTGVEKKLFEGRVNVVVVGDGGCGKTSLLYAFSRNEFPEQYLPTVFETSVTDIDVNGMTVELQLWDTAGQEEYDRLRPLSYMDADVIVVCYSISNPDSLVNVVDRWLPEVSHFCPGRPIILAGNKLDLRPETPSTAAVMTSRNSHCGDVTVSSQPRPPRKQRCTSTARGEEVGTEIGARRFVECSARTREQVREVFLAAASAGVSARRHRHRQTSCSVL